MSPEQESSIDNVDDYTDRLKKVGQRLADVLTELRTGNNLEYEPLSLPMDAYPALDEWAGLTSDD